MRLRTACALTLLLSLAAASPALAAGNANFILGERYLDDMFWESADLDRQGLFGANIDYGESGWPVRVMFGIHGSGVLDWNDSDDVFGFGDEPEAAVVELSLGAVWMPPTGRIQPYLGLGASHVYARVDLGAGSENDSLFAAYANGGVFWRIGERLNVGFDGRLLRGSDFRFNAVELGYAPGTFPRDRIEVSADDFQIGFLVGFGWGD